MVYNTSCINIYMYNASSRTLPHPRLDVSRSTGSPYFFRRPPSFAIFSSFSLLATFYLDRLRSHTCFLSSLHVLCIYKKNICIYVFHVHAISCWSFQVTAAASAQHSAWYAGHGEAPFIFIAFVRVYADLYACIWTVSLHEDHWDQLGGFSQRVNIYRWTSSGYKV